MPQLSEEDSGWVLVRVIVVGGIEHVSCFNESLGKTPNLGAVGVVISSRSYCRIIGSLAVALRPATVLSYLCNTSGQTFYTERVLESLG